MEKIIAAHCQTLEIWASFSLLYDAEIYNVNEFQIYIFDKLIYQNKPSVNFYNLEEIFFGDGKSFFILYNSYAFRSSTRRLEHHHGRYLSYCSKGLEEYIIDNGKVLSGKFL